MKYPVLTRLLARCSILSLATFAPSLFADAAVYTPPDPIELRSPSEREALYLRNIKLLKDVAWEPERILGNTSEVDFTGAAVLENSLDPFWRTRVMPDQWLQKAAWGLPTSDPIFDLLEQETNRLFTHVPLNSIGADTISAVRLLGGWKIPEPIESHDLVYREEDGSLAYRWALLHKRIDPIVENGLTPLIVLDNVPYALAPEGVVPNPAYGQNMAPTDFEEWETFVEALCRELKSRYGEELAGTWRYRVGTEADNPNHWEDRAPDSLEKYLKAYDHAAAAVLRVFPEARIGPSNFNSMFAGEFHRSVDPRKVMEHFAFGENYATGATGSAIDFLPISFYGLYHMGGNFPHPDADEYGYSPEALRLHARYLNDLRNIHPKFADLPLEIQEHGNLHNEAGQVSHEPGAFGAAWTAAQYAVALQEGIDELFVWQDYQPLGGGVTLLYGNAWLRTMLEKMRGGTVYDPTIRTTSMANWIYAFSVVQPDRIWIVISNYHRDRAVAHEEDIAVELPVDWIGSDSLDGIEMYQLNRNNAPMDIMHRRLAEAGELTGPPNGLGNMATQAGAHLIRQQRDAFWQLQLETFRPQPFDGRVSQENGVFRLRFEAPTPSVTILSIPRKKPVPLGTLKPFYRGQAVLGEFLSSGGLQTGGEIAPVPGYLKDPELDFPYRARDPEAELMFTDRITAVRFLGGIGDALIPNPAEHGWILDLAKRRPDGAIYYDWSPLDRFDRYVEIFGPHITIVLDNIPIAFVENPVVDNYGQIAPPDDYAKWSEFLRAMAREMVRRYSRETVSQWRFRVLTEGRLATDTEGFNRHYDHTVAALLSVLPEARFAPFNKAAIHMADQQDIDIFEFMGHATGGRNHATGGIGSPVDFVPVSYYSVPLTVDDAATKGPLVVLNPKDDWLNRWSISPELRVQQDYLPYWRKMDDARTDGFHTPREIQELGILTAENGLRTSEPGARGAAWLHQLLFNMKETAGIDAAWHWHVTDVLHLPEEDPHTAPRLLRSNGWLYQVLDHLVGSEAYSLPVRSVPQGDADFSLKATYFENAPDGADYLILSAFNIDRSTAKTFELQVELPGLADAPFELQAVRLNRETDVHERIRRDLAENGHLAEGFQANPAIVSTVNGYRQPTDGMTDAAGIAFIQERFGDYAAIIVRNLTLGDAPDARIESHGATRQLVTTLTTPEVAVFRIARETSH